MYARINYNLACDAYDLHVTRQAMAGGFILAGSRAYMDRFHTITGVLTREQVIAHADQMTDDINAAACDGHPLEDIIARVKSAADFR